AVTDFTIYEGLLLGSIVSSTDSAAVFSILRSKNVALKGNLRPLLELESGSNDPMAYILTIIFTGLVTTPETSLWNIIPMFLRQLLLGGLLGFLFGKLGTLLINKIRLEYEGLYTVLVIAIMFFCFSATNFVGGNGFLAVYLSAVYLGNQELIHKKKILKAWDGFAWLMQIVLFLTLGLLVFPKQIVPVIGIGLIISLFLIVIARPVSVFISLIPFRIQARSRWLISWVGLRGAVPIVFATYPLIAGAEKAGMIFNIVFFISITSVLIQGITLPVVAKWLHLTLPEKLKQRTPADMDITDSIKSILTEIVIPETSLAVGRQIVELGLPKTSVISYIQRDYKYLTPTGSTTLMANDVLSVLSENQDSLTIVYRCLDLKESVTAKEPLID
ncbi:MAG TPA: potassium/proton antiporter, partial [Bacteroidales bacterium]|nr:potassium/proton antiporter [Bacteroidales bacterium]